MTAFTVNLNSILEITDDQFYQLCRNNPEIKFERNAKGELIIMSPTGGETGKQNFELATDFGIWNRQAKLGVCFDSSTCFKLPNGADRSPDIAWIKQERWDSLKPEQRQKFPPICPDFVLELMSPTDRLTVTQAKMEEYLKNGVRLGWLINPQARQVEIYRPGQVVEVLESPKTLSGEEVLPGFVLDLHYLWST
ncbi:MULTISPECIES: Uma2 family endonuclease [unclassified Moorena]|uniref:Uma2 family endonuclease n=1 Tax=unclassified Moorena TaxID=2683338 RepID=UPI0013FF963B|nr:MULTISPECIES: Uma2 family endonuclease [unclassified Moorena]NEO11214.1 Uma2 family endonuclease [Moorena sp. SIO3E8]NEQ00148.1 Uma2 family endonuclease [Moorena sp. SIO3F7]